MQITPKQSNLLHKFIFDRDWMIETLEKKYISKSDRDDIAGQIDDVVEVLLEIYKEESF